MDLISYEIKALSPRLELGELVESYGDSASYYKEFYMFG